MYIIATPWLVSAFITAAVPKCILCLRLLVIRYPSPSDQVSDTQVALQACISKVLCEVVLNSVDNEWQVMRVWSRAMDH